MLVRAYPEIFINNTNNIDITDTTNAILNPDILEKYQDELLDNKNGCIFKIINNDSENCICVEDYVACKEFNPKKVYLLGFDLNYNDYHNIYANTDHY